MCDYCTIGSTAILRVMMHVFSVADMDSNNHAYEDEGPGEAN